MPGWSRRRFGKAKRSGWNSSATYLHSCIKYVENKRATNASLRERFGIADRNASVATRLLNDAVDAGMIAVMDPTAGYRWRAYLPFWAAERADEAGTVI